MIDWFDILIVFLNIFFFWLSPPTVRAPVFTITPKWYKKFKSAFQIYYSIPIWQFYSSSLSLSATIDNFQLLVKSISKMNLAVSNPKSVNQSISFIVFVKMFKLPLIRSCVIAYSEGGGKFLKSNYGWFKTQNLHFFRSITSVFLSSVKIIIIFEFIFMLS